MVAPEILYNVIGFNKLYTKQNDGCNRMSNHWVLSKSTSKNG